MSESSDRELLDLIRRSGPVTVAEMAEHLGVTGTAIRNRLARLLGSGLVERRAEHQGRGRPRHTYQASVLAQKQLGQNYADLAVALWEEMMGTVPDRKLRRHLFIRVTERMAEMYRGQVSGQEWEGRLVQLTNLLHDRGVEAEVAQDAGRPIPILRQHSCPYYELAEADRAICASSERCSRKCWAEACGSVSAGSTATASATSRPSRLMPPGPGGRRRPRRLSRMRTVQHCHRTDSKSDRLMSKVLSIQNLHVAIAGKEILRGVDLTMRQGEVHALMGPNGSGKSTLSYALMGHPNYEVTEGSITLDGVDLLALEPDERAKAGMFLAFQYPTSIPGVSVANFLRHAVTNVRNPDRKEGEDLIPMRDFRKELREQMDELGVDQEFARRYLNDGFSGGEKKRAEILQLAMLRPAFAILDETDSGLDIDAVRIVSEGVNRVAARHGTGVLVITHYERILTYIKPQFVHILFGGRIVEDGGPELVKLLEKQGYDWVREKHPEAAQDEEEPGSGPRKARPAAMPGGPASATDPDFHAPNTTPRKKEGRQPCRPI